MTVCQSQKVLKYQIILLFNDSAIFCSVQNVICESPKPHIYE